MDTKLRTGRSSHQSSYGMGLYLKFVGRILRHELSQQDWLQDREVIRVDKSTSQAKQGQFTRSSVEIYLSKPLLSTFWLKGRI